MSAVSLLGPVPGVTPEREVGRGASGGSIADFASVLSDENLRLCESHFRPRADDASGDVPAENGGEGPATNGADTTGALLLQLAAHRDSSADAVTTTPGGASTAADEATPVSELAASDADDGSTPAAPAVPLSTTELTTIDPTMTGAAGSVTSATIGAGEMTGVAPVGMPPAETPTAETAVTPAGESLSASDAAAPRPAGDAAVAAAASAPAGPATVVPPAPLGQPVSGVSPGAPSTSLAVDGSTALAASSGAASSGVASGSSDDAPAVAVDRAQPSASATPTVVGATAPAAPTAPAASPDAAAATTRAVAAQVSPVVVSIAQRPAGTHHLTLTVNPDSLGPVTLRAHITAAGDVQVELSGATEIGREALRTMLVDLRRDLAAVMPHATLSMGSGAGADSPTDRGGQPGAGGAAGDPSAGERDGRPRQHPESDHGRTPSGVIPITTTTTAAGAGLDIFA